MSGVYVFVVKRNQKCTYSVCSPLFLILSHLCYSFVSNTTLLLELPKKCFFFVLYFISKLFSIYQHFIFAKYVISIIEVVLSNVVVCIVRKISSRCG